MAVVNFLGGILPHRIFRVLISAHNAQALIAGDHSYMTHPLWISPLPQNIFPCEPHLLRVVDFSPIRFAVLIIAPSPQKSKHNHERWPARDHKAFDSGVNVYDVAQAHVGIFLRKTLCNFTILLDGLTCDPMLKTPHKRTWGMLCFSANPQVDFSANPLENLGGWAGLWVIENPIQFQ